MFYYLKKILAVALVALMLTTITAFAVEVTPSESGDTGLTVQEIDASPSVGLTKTLKVTNGSLTDNGDGSVTLDVSGSSAGDVVGPASSILDNIAVFADTTGKLLKDGLAKLTDFLLLAGRSGGQTIVGGTAASDGLNLSSTSNATKGTVRIGDATTGAFFDETNSRLSIGGSENTTTVGGTVFGSKISSHIEGIVDGIDVSAHRHTDTAGFGSHFLLTRSRGTEALETAVVSGDFLSRINSLGHDGTDYEIASQIDTIVDGAVSANIVPASMTFSTTTTAGVLTEALRINNDQTISMDSGTTNIAAAELNLLDGVTGSLTTPATTDTFTNKTFNANGTGNSLSNVDIADLSNGTDGELITWSAVGAPATVAVGTSGQVLTSNGAGAAPTMQAVSAGGSSVITGGSGTIGIANGTSYFPFGNLMQTENQTVSATARTPIGRSGTISNFRMYVGRNTSSTATPFVFVKNGTDTSLGITVSAGVAGDKNDTVNSFTVVAGDYVYIKTVKSSATGTIDRIRYSFEYL